MNWHKIAATSEAKATPFGTVWALMNDERLNPEAVRVYVGLRKSLSAKTVRPFPGIIGLAVDLKLTRLSTRRALETLISSGWALDCPDDKTLVLLDAATGKGAI